VSADYRLRSAAPRLLLLVPILLGLSILVFLWIRALPGGPAQALLGERATPQAIQQIEHEYGLDKPLPVQYWRYLQTVGKLDFGQSVTTRRDVTTELKQKFPATVELAMAAMIFSIIFGIPLGFFAAKRYGGLFDNLSLVGSLIGVSIPIFFLGIILKYIFAIKLGLLPTVGRIDVLIEIDHPTGFYVLDALIAGNMHAFVDTLKHLILPAIALGSIPLSIIARITRAAVLDVQNEDYVRTARAKGMSPGIVDRRHVLRNALLPIVTVIGLQVGFLLAGAVLTETVFAWPGIGTWLVDAIESRNYPVLQGGILFVALVFVLVNLIVDVSYAILNPRIRLS
jgi:peptide/nickel transport system permease protein